MSNRFIRRLRLGGFLSFEPGSEAFDLRPLNVLIGPNGSGKSNVIEAVGLLQATPTDFAAAIRQGGGASEWLWKGQAEQTPAILDVELDQGTPTGRPLRYRLEFTAVQNRVEVLDEALEEIAPQPGNTDFYYRLKGGRAAITVKVPGAGRGGRPVHQTLRLGHDMVMTDQSVLAERKDPDLYPEVTWLGRQFAGIQIFREWTFGRSVPLRQPQPADLPEDRLLPDARNLAIVLHEIEHKGGRRIDQLLKRFFPRFERLSTRVSGGTVQLYLHEPGFAAPIPPTRLSDGTLRFIALLATLLAPTLPPLICIEEPELGLHPDAMALIAELLIETSDRTQLIVTTHSDALVSALTAQPDAVVACERPGVGTTLRRLDPKRLASWLDSYRLGDLWRMGELGANP